MRDVEKREAWLKELKELRRELLEKKEGTTKGNGKTFQKSSNSIASKMYTDNKNETAKVQILMLALLTLLFETLFFVGSYLLFR